MLRRLAAIIKKHMDVQVEEWQSAEGENKATLTLLFDGIEIKRVTFNVGRVDCIEHSLLH